MDVRRENGCTSRKWMYVEKMDVRRENGCTSRKWMYVCQTKEMYMHTIRLFSTVIMALLLMGCPPPAGHNSNDSDSGGNASAGSDPQPKAIVVSQVSAGNEHSMILKTDGTLWATGRNIEGQLADDSTDQKRNPVKVMNGVAQVSAGFNYTMIVKKNGELWGVGSNGNGQLGDNSQNPKLNPVQVKTADGTVMTEVDKVSSGYDHTMILKTNGDLWAVGNNGSGQLGDGTNDPRRLTPVQVMEMPDGGPARPMTGVAQVSAGFSHTMIVKKNGELWATGDNSVGQLADGRTVNQSNPVQVMIDVAQVSAGRFFTMIVRTDDSLWAVGGNSHGQLGDGTQNPKPNPEQILPNVAYVSAGANHTMIVVKNGELWAVGNNRNGQLGTGEGGVDVVELNPVQVMEIPAVGAPAQKMTGVAQVSASENHSMILKQNGSLWAVGTNFYGQLGNGKSGANARELTPVEITVE